MMCRTKDIFHRLSYAFILLLCLYLAFTDCPVLAFVVYDFKVEFYKFGTQKLVYRHSLH